MKKIKVFVDSDVVISSLISNSGAAYFILNQANLEIYISNISQYELEEVVDRLGIEKSRLEKIIKNRFNKIQIKSDLKEWKKEFAEYTSDPEDVHIVAGAREAQVRFLVSYNIRHFKAEKIKQHLNIILTTPANLLQYLRSL